VQRRSASPSRDRNSSRSDAESSSSALRLALPSRPPADSTYARPERVAFFSYGPARELRFDSSAKRRFREPPTGVDLGHRFGAAVWREEQVCPAVALRYSPADERLSAERASRLAHRDTAAPAVQLHTAASTA
jgi:hypothetical protein